MPVLGPGGGFLAFVLLSILALPPAQAPASATFGWGEVYELPAGFMIAANLAHRNGAWSVRRSRVSSDITNIPEGTNIFLQRRGENERLPDVTQLDMRLQKDFKFGEQARLGVFVDALNLLNDDVYETVQSTLATSSVFDYPLSPVLPRRLMLGAKFRF